MSSAAIYIQQVKGSAHHAQVELYFSYSLLQSTNESVIRRASMMGEMHLRNLRQKSLLKQRTEDALKKLQVSKTQGPVVQS